MTLCAVDGATTQSIAQQLRRVPQDASHIVIAIGGNDALAQSDLLDRAVRSTAEQPALGRSATIIYSSVTQRFT